jgi:hypothetical protein
MNTPNTIPFIERRELLRIAAVATSTFVFSGSSRSARLGGQVVASDTLLPAQPSSDSLDTITAERRGHIRPSRLSIEEAAARGELTPAAAIAAYRRLAKS